MPFIEKRQPKARTKTVSVQLRVEVGEDLKEYVKFIGKPQGDVVNEILMEVFRRDKDFAEWKKNKSANVSAMAEPKVASR